MASVHGVGTWRVVLKVDLRELPLRGAQDLILILEVVLGRLIDDEVQIQIPHLMGGDLAHVRGQVEGGPAPAIAYGAPRLDGQIPVVVDAGQRIEVAALDVPDQDLQALHCAPPVHCWTGAEVPVQQPRGARHAVTPITSNRSAASITASGSTQYRQRWSIGQTV